MGEKKKPTHEFKLGRIRAAIWANRSENRDVWFSVRLSRLYKDGDQWNSADSFSHEELPIVAKAADMAYSWIWRRRMALSKAAKEHGEK